MSSGSLIFPLSGVQSWKDPVATVASLPASGNTAGDARAAIDTGIIYVWNGAAWQAPSGSGTVTSVGMTVPSFLSVAGSPVTTAGTLAVTLATQVQNTIFSGPASGADATPTFRLLVAADIPNLPASIITSGTLAVARGGTNLGSGTSGGILGFTASGVIASSVALTASALVLGGGAGATPTPMASLGTTTTVLHGNAVGAPTFGAVSLTADVSGTLPVTAGGTNNTTFTAYSVICAGTTATGAFQNVSGLGTAAQVLTSNGAGALPTWQAAGGSSPADSTWFGYGVSGKGSSGTCIAIYGTQLTNTGTDITYATSATNGDKWTINTTGRYAICMAMGYGAGNTTGRYGITKNQATLTQFIGSVSDAEFIADASTAAVDNPYSLSRTVYLTAGDVIRVNVTSALTITNTRDSWFSITRVG